MPRLTLTVSLIVSLLVAAACHAADRAPAKGDVQHVVLVSIDGLAASYLADKRADLPTLRKLAAEGASARGMITSFPSVTWPSHTSLITGVQPARHGVIGNNVWDRKNNRGLTYIGDPTLTKDEAVRAPTLYDHAHEAGLTCGAVIWPCVNGARTLDWAIPDSNKPELHAKYTTPGFVAELTKAGIDATKLGEWGWNKERSSDRDILYTKVGNYLLDKHHVNLLLVHLIRPDGVEHAYGPHTPEAYQSVAEADERIAEIWATLQKPPLAGKSTLFVVSDHGFAPYQKNVRPNVVLREMGLVAVGEDDKVTGRKAWCVPQGGCAFLYVLETEKQDATIAALKKRFAAVEGVTGVLEPAEFAKLGLPLPENNAEAPHLVLTTGPGYAFADPHLGEAVVDAGGLKGTHGHVPSPDYMHATFVAAGAGIKPGTTLDIIRNVDVAPTIARLLGIEMKDVDGKVLTDILDR
jgi:predicted AlkP superfamily pyrophosphatase or phosphodiesterase